MELNNNMEIVSLFPSPLARIRIDKYFKDEVWYLKKGYELNSIECIALVEYIEEQVELYMRNVIGLKPKYKYEIDDLAVIKTWEECSDHFGLTNGNIVAQGVMSLEVPNNLCKLAVHCYTGMREHLFFTELTGDSPWFQTWTHIPMAENELIILPGGHGPGIDELHDEPAMFVVFNIKTK